MIFPHPTVPELLISAQIFILLYPLRWVAHLFESEVTKDARYVKGKIIRSHVYNDHGFRWKHCRVDDCASLVSSLEVPVQ